MKTVALLIFCLAGICTAGHAEDFGEPNIALLVEANQWVFARGLWEVTTSFRNADGEMERAEQKAEVKVWYLADGLTVQSTFRIGDDFFSSQIKTYDKTQKKWISHFVNSKRQRHAITESRWIDGEMITLNVQGYSGSDPFMTREVDSEISENQFVKTISRSEDLGGSWGPPIFRMEFRRIR